MVRPSDLDWVPRVDRAVVTAVITRSTLAEVKSATVGDAAVNLARSVLALRSVVMPMVLVSVAPVPIRTLTAVPPVEAVFNRLTPSKLAPSSALLIS